MRGFESQHDILLLVCEKCSNVLDPRLVRGEGSAPETTVMSHRESMRT